MSKRNKVKLQSEHIPIHVGMAIMVLTDWATSVKVKVIIDGESRKFEARRKGKLV